MTATFPKVFLSYSHDSPTHNDRVLALANRLRSDGIDCVIDQFQPSPPEGWLRWMNNQIENADIVLCGCTPTYCRRIMGRDSISFRSTRMSLAPS